MLGLTETVIRLLCLRRDEGGGVLQDVAGQWQEPDLLKPVGSLHFLLLASLPFLLCTVCLPPFLSFYFTLALPEMQLYFNVTDKTKTKKKSLKDYNLLNIHSVFYVYA